MIRWAWTLVLLPLVFGPRLAWADDGSTPVEDFAPPAEAATPAAPNQDALPRGGIRLVGGLGWMEGRAALEGEGWPFRYLGFGGALARANFNQHKSVDNLLGLGVEENMTVDSLAASMLVGTGGHTVRAVLRLGGGVAHLQRDRSFGCFLFDCHEVKPIDATVAMGSLAGGVLVNSSWASISALLQTERYRGYGGSVFFSLGFGLSLPPSE